MYYIYNYRINISQGLILEMNIETENIQFSHVISYILVVNVTVAVFLNMLWIIFCVKNFLSVSSMYRLHKSTPSLPFYRDVQILSKERNLYNLQTIRVKFILMVLYLATEMVAISWVGLAYYVQSALSSSPILNVTLHEFEPNYSTSCIHTIFVIVYIFPSYIIMYNFTVFLYLMLFFLLSILTRYLSARYLRHPFRLTFVKYFMWYLLQVFIIAYCSTLPTFIYSFVFFPIISVIDWVVVMRDTRVLSRVLKSHLLETGMHSTKELYKRVKYAYNLYRIFRLVLGFSLLQLVLSFATVKLLHLCMFILNPNCTLGKYFGLEVFNVNLLPEQINIAIIISKITYIIYTFSLSIPLICVTVYPTVRKCVQRYKSRNNVYRYNYGNIRQEIAKNKKKNDKLINCMNC